MYGHVVLYPSAPLAFRPAWDARVPEIGLGRGRPRRAKPGGQREIARTVLAAAERLLAERPLEELTVADLIEAAGISRASFYFYFESKNAVATALLEQTVDQLDETARPWLERSDRSPEEAIRIAIRDSLALWRRHAPVLRAAVESWQSVPEIRELWGGVVGRFTEAAAKQIERERRAGLAPADGPDAEVLAGALIAMNERCFYFAIVGAGPGSDEKLIDTLASIWLAAVYGRT
jgi:AcrR family transcriptional regulator